MGKVEPVEFESYEATLERFQQTWLKILKGISNNSNIVISSEARNPLFVVRKKQILRPAPRRKSSWGTASE